MPQLSLPELPLAPEPMQTDGRPEAMQTDAKPKRRRPVETPEKRAERLAKSRERAREYRKRRPDVHKSWRDKNRERLRKYNRERYSKNREARVKARREYYARVQGPRQRKTASVMKYFRERGVSVDDLLATLRIED